MPDQSNSSRVLTLVFTDLADSTALKTERGDAAVSDLIARHRSHVTDIANQLGGSIVDWAGDGCFLTFDTPSAAAEFALRLQSIHHAKSDLPGVRIGVHMGEVTDRPQDEQTRRVEGLAVDLAARISGLAAPGQILLSEAVFNSARQRLRGENLDTPIAWRAHGLYELKGFDEPMALCEVGLEGISPLTAPTGSEKAHRAVTPTEEDTLGWRPAVGLHVPRRENWVLEDRLGEGGYGEVWMAAHEKTKAKRVFKFCFDPERVRGLKREVVLFRLLKESLGHRDDIAQIVDWEFERPPYFLESEYTEGGDLKDWAERHGGLDKIPLQTRLELVAQAAEALGAAHSVGVLHKDIKPGNILVTEVAGKDTPRASLTDFGIGLITDPGALAAQGITAVGLTQTLIGSSSSDSHSGAGTRLYMAPEILEGKAATTLSDTYSLGVVLYQMVLGDLDHAIAPGWERDIQDDLLREDIALCTDGSPERRLKSAEELAERLRTLDERRLERKRRAAAKRRRRLLTASTIVGPIVTIIILAFAIQQSRLVDEANRQREVAEAASERARQSAEEAQRQRTEAEALRAEAERGQYVANIRLAATMLDQDNLASARPILEATPVQYRDWEWGHLVNRAWPPDNDARSGLPPAPPGKTTDEIWRGANARLLTTLVGHESLVTAVMFHPNGKHVVTVSKDNTARIWDIASANELRRIPLPLSPSHRFAHLDPTGRILWTQYQTGTLGLWNLDTGELVREFAGHTDEAQAGPISPDGNLASSISLDRTMIVWDVATGDRLNALDVPLPRQTPFTFDVAFLPNSSRALVALPDNQVAEWDYTSGEIVRTIQGPRPDIFQAGRITPNGRLVSSWAPSTSSMVTWDSATGEEVASGTFGASSIAHPLAWAPDSTAALYRGNEIAFVISPYTDSSANKPIRVTQISGWFGGAFNHSGNLIALPDAEGQVRIFVPGERNVSPEELVQAHSDVAYSARFSSDGSLLVTTGFDGSVRIMDADTLQTIREFHAHDGEITTATISAQNRYLQTFGYDDYHRLWDLQTGELLFETKGNLPPTFAGGARGPSVRVSANLLGAKYSVSHDLTRVAMPTGRGEITVKRIPSGEVDFIARYDAEWSYKSGFSPDGNYLLNLPYQETFVTLFDGHTGETIAELRGHEGQIIDRKFSPDGSRIITTSIDGTARLWDGRTGEPTLSIEVSGAGAFTADFSPDGSLCAVSSPDGRAAIFATDSGEEVTRLSAQGGIVNAVGFSPDGQRLLTGCMDNVLRVWNLRGDLLSELSLGEGELFYYTGWSPDGRSIVATTSAGTARVWRAVDWTQFTDPVTSEEAFESQLARIRGN